MSGNLSTDSSVQGNSPMMNIRNPEDEEEKLSYVKSSSVGKGSIDGIMKKYSLKNIIEV